MGKVKGFRKHSATENTGQVFEYKAASSLAADTTETISCTM